MQYCYTNNGISFTAVSNHHVAAPGETLSATFLTTSQKQSIFPFYTSTFSGLSKDMQICVLQSQLDYLDNTIPRGLEDYWTQIGYNTSLLPSSTQNVLALKVSLRAQIVALG